MANAPKSAEHAYYIVTYLKSCDFSNGNLCLFVQISSVWSWTIFFIGGPICRIHQSASRIHGATGQDTGDGPHVECVACWYKARQQGGLGTFKNDGNQPSCSAA